MKKLYLVIGIGVVALVVLFVVYKLSNVETNFSEASVNSSNPSYDSLDYFKARISDLIERDTIFANDKNFKTNLWTTKDKSLEDELITNTPPLRKSFNDSLERAREFYENNEFFDAILIYNSLLNDIESINNYDLLSDINLELSKCHWRIETLDKARSILYNGFFYVFQSRNIEQLMEYCNQVSLVLVKEERFTLARDYVTISFELSKKRYPKELHRFQNVLGMCYAGLGDSEKSLQLFHKAHKYAESNQLKKEQTRYLNNIGSYYNLIKPNTDSSIYYLKKACKIVEGLDQNLSAAIYYTNLGEAFLREGKQTDSARYYITRAMKIGKDVKSWQTIVRANTILLEIARKDNDISSQLDLMNSVIRSNDSLNLTLTKNTLQSNQIVYQDSLATLEIEKDNLLKQEALSFEKEKISLWLYLSATITVLLITILIVVTINIKRKNKIKEIENARRNQKEQFLQEQLNAKLREISSLSLLRASNDKIIHSVKEILNSRKISQTIKGDVEKEIVKIKNEIKISQSYNSSMDAFQKNFNQLNPDFIRKLKEISPSLTFGEIKHCVLIKNNLSSEEISNLMGVEKAYLRNARYRIHKKLKLEKGIKLQDFILTLD